MKLAILFWFYKDVALCRNRLQVLRKHSPDAPIWGLYGGDPERAGEFEKALRGYLDDFYVFDDAGRDSWWKWYHGDLMIARWYRDRGKQLLWDTVVVVQWDMLVVGALDELFPSLKEDELLLSGLRPVREVEHWWFWPDHGSARDGSTKAKYRLFLEHVRNRYGYDADPLCCLFIVVCLPRSFLDRYVEIEKPELGFLEYKIPIYGQVFGARFCQDHPYRPWWPDPSSPPPSARDEILNAKGKGISLALVVRELFDPGGAKIFHPFKGFYPMTVGQWVSILAGRLLGEVRRRFRR